MERGQVARVAELGATFALSPANPPGMIEDCLAAGVVPWPVAAGGTGAGERGACRTEAMV